MQEIKKNRISVFRIPNTFFENEPDDLGQHLYRRFIDSFQSQRGKTFKQYFHFHCPHLGGHKPYTALCSIKSAIKNRIYNAEVWVYANKFKVISKKINGYFDKEVLFDYDTKNWVLDIDNHPTFKTIKDVRLWFRKRTGGLPFKILQTRRSNFHVVINGPADVWTDQNVTSLILKLCEIPKDSKLTKKELEEHIKTYHGIDIGYLSQNPWMSKYRALGTPRLDGGEPWTVEGWENTRYQYKKLFSKLREGFLDTKPITDSLPKEDGPKKKNLLFLFGKEKKKVEDVRADIKDRFYIRIKMVLESVLTKNVAAIFSDLFVNNFGHLTSGRYVGGGQQIANLVGLSRETVSKALNALMKADILVKTAKHIYIPGHVSRASEFGFTQKLFNLINYEERKQDTYKQIEAKQNLKDKLSEPYVGLSGGQLNDNYLADIRRLFILGVSEEDSVSVILNKFSSLQNVYRRKVGEISKAVRSFFKIADNGLRFIRKRNGIPDMRYLNQAIKAPPGLRLAG